MQEDVPNFSSINDLNVFLDSVIFDTRKSLLSTLDEDDMEYLDESLQSFKKRELGFYSLVISKLQEYIGEKNEEEFYLFFDIDETIAKRNSDLHKDSIRPSLKFLLSTLKQQYPNVHFAICSARGQEAIEDFIKNNTEYDFEIGYSSRDLPSYSPDISWGEYCTMGHNNKAHAMIDITLTYVPFRCILVDDIIESSFEDKQIGISIRDVAFYGFPGENNFF